MTLGELVNNVNLYVEYMQASVIIAKNNKTSYKSVLTPPMNIDQLMDSFQDFNLIAISIEDSVIKVSEDFSKKEYDEFQEKGE